MKYYGNIKSGHWQDEKTYVITEFEPTPAPLTFDEYLAWLHKLLGDKTEAARVICTQEAIDKYKEAISKLPLDK